jgi:hypothetical protein
MPVNFQEIQIQVREMGQAAQLRKQELNARLDLAERLLYQYATEQEAVRTRIDQAAAASSYLRCAVPGDEALTSQVEVPGLKCEYVLLAADGSQVIPSHHDAVEFGVINVGAIRLLPGQPYAPREIVHSRMLFHESLYNSEGSPLTEEVIALMRDIAERKVLGEYARLEQVPVVTLTDGQLEIYGESKQSREFKDKLDEYKQVLLDLSQLEVVTAGYVEKPASDLAVRMLDLMLLDPSELDKAGKKRPLRGIRDRDLFGRLLGSCQRSAVFSIQARQQHLDGPLAVHFFYLNVSNTNHANIARVEIPAWVARDPALVDLLHFALVGQCRQMGSRPYPYALHRSHEIAVVSFDEKNQLTNMILLEMRRLGVDVEDISNKQYAKDLAGRTRYS